MIKTQAKIQGVYVEKAYTVDVSKAYLKLRDEKDRITLLIVNENGERVWCGNILFLHKHENGITLERAFGVNPSMGLALDEDGKVQFEENTEVSDDKNPESR